jgi:hypothetical protein
MIKAALILLLLGGCLCGCVSKDADHWERQKEMMAFAAELAEKHGAAWVLELNGRGIGSVGMKNDFYIDTGIDGSITIHGNAQTGAR